mmetsp:Transcript_29909/g.77224  ORF Transcript_29909/g.77224 Transcript_29909/m.77224 type:complete len:250 (-) Transcript_29909:480-1229(-)
MKKFTHVKRKRSDVHRQEPPSRIFIYTHLEGLQPLGCIWNTLPKQLLQYQKINAKSIQACEKRGRTDVVQKCIQHPERILFIIHYFNIQASYKANPLRVAVELSFPAECTQYAAKTLPTMTTFLKAGQVLEHTRSICVNLLENVPHFLCRFPTTVDGCGGLRWAKIFARRSPSSRRLSIATLIMLVAITPISAPFLFKLHLLYHVQVSLQLLPVLLDLFKGADVLNYFINAPQIPLVRPFFQHFLTKCA